MLAVLWAKLPHSTALCQRGYVFNDVTGVKSLIFKARYFVFMICRYFIHASIGKKAPIMLPSLPNLPLNFSKKF